ncbi:MAG TPA: hypothetical protein DDW21_10675 [Verrucomicrobiales bacterium]|nr:hypothetical protein [Verrucomicrobiales bacterium]
MLHRRGTTQRAPDEIILRLTKTYNARSYSTAGVFLSSNTLTNQTVQMTVIAVSTSQ